MARGDRKAYGGGRRGRSGAVKTAGKVLGRQIIKGFIKAYSRSLLKSAALGASVQNAAMHKGYSYVQARRIAVVAMQKTNRQTLLRELKREGIQSVSKAARQSIKNARLRYEAKRGEKMGRTERIAIRTAAGVTALATRQTIRRAVRVAYATARNPTTRRMIRTAAKIAMAAYRNRGTGSGMHIPASIPLEISAPYIIR